MFKVFKSIQPIEWTGKNYRDSIIVHQLKKDFHGKCYICEQKHFPNINVEHFIPHQGDKKLELDWNNLYFACSRCNSIKGNNYNNMLDCCDSSHLVEEWIKIYYRLPDEDIEVINACPSNHPFYSNADITKNLIFSCLNNNNSGIQELSKEDLREKILLVQNDFLKLRKKFFIKLDNWSDEKKIQKAENIKRRLESKYPFSAILRGYLEKDKKWKTALEEIEKQNP